MLANKLMTALSGSVEGKLYVDDVFSAYTYTGNGSAQTINNGIDLAGKGGLVWTKDRTLSYAHKLIDSANGFSYSTDTASTAARGFLSAISAFNSDGYSLNADAYGNWNKSGDSYISWTFRKAPKFFDVVTFTNASGVVVNHSLGQTPGMIIVKSLSSGVTNWGVWHRNATGEMYLNTTGAAAPSFNFFDMVTTTSFRAYYGTPGESYVAYLFAHDPSPDGIIQCGSFTTDASANATVNLGWEPQYVMLKSTSATGNWVVTDVMRGMPVGAGSNQLYPNTSGVENASIGQVSPSATGFSVSLGSSTTYIYLAIRRPNKPPTTGTEVYNAVTRSGTHVVPWKATGAGFPPDMTIMSGRSAYAITNLSTFQHSVIDRLRRSPEHIQTINTNGEGGGWDSGHIHNMDGYDGLYSNDGAHFNISTGRYVDFHFRRAPGFFDVVCYTGTGAARTEPHGLGVIPELTIVKRRGVTGSWLVHPKSLGANGLLLESTAGSAGYTFAFNLNGSTATALNMGTSSDENSATTYVAYLFATLPGISKVGSYTGNGTTQTINCGFTTGARFILIKRTDSTGDWYVWDTARGITSEDDPHLSLNTATAEVMTDDSVDPDVSGFIVNQVAATNINVSGGQYIFLAIA